MLDLLPQAEARFRALQQRGAAFFGTEMAILGGAMSWVSERNLVAAISNAGGFGVIACGAMTTALLEAEIAGTQALTQKPFGVNLITMHPDLDVLVQVCLRAKVGHIVFAGGIPPGPAIRAATPPSNVSLALPGRRTRQGIVAEMSDALSKMSKLGASK